MNLKDWSDAWRLLGYIEGVNDCESNAEGHDLIQEAVNALAEILDRNAPKGEKK